MAERSVPKLPHVSLKAAGFDPAPDPHLVPVDLLPVYLARAEGDCCRPVIRDGDWMVCDRTCEIKPGRFVIYRLDGGRPQVKQLLVTDGVTILHRTNPEMEDTMIEDPSRLEFLAEVHYVTRTREFAQYLAGLRGGVGLGRDGIPVLDMDAVEFCPWWIARAQSAGDRKKWLDGLEDGRLARMKRPRRALYAL